MSKKRDYDDHVEIIGKALIENGGADGNRAILLGQLRPYELQALASLLRTRGYPHLVTWHVEPEEDDSAPDEMLSERYARAIAVDHGVKAARFTAAVALGEIKQVERRGERRYFTEEGLLEWIDGEVAKQDQREWAEEQQDLPPTPDGPSEGYRTPWYTWPLVLAAIGLLVFVIVSGLRMETTL